MSKKKNFFRVNVVIVYSEHLNLNNFQTPIHSIFRHLSWLHRLEYAIVAGDQISDKSDLTKNYCEVVYFRATESTIIVAKDIRRIVSDIFQSSIPATAGVDIFCQLQKYLSQYPFPQEYTLPLNYPCFEVTEAGKKSLYVSNEALKFETPQDWN